MAVAAWIAYLCVHFVLVPGWFVWRYRRSPYALRWLPRSGYEVGESAYGWLVIGYTVAVLFGPQTEPRSPVLALACVIAGSGLILSAVATLRSNWRIGQDEGDTTCVYVAEGPYRLVLHPIYLGMTISAFGQMLLTNGDIRGLILLLGTVGYVLVQGRAESLRWSSQQRGSKADIQDSRPNQPLQQTGHAKDGPFSSAPSYRVSRFRGHQDAPAGLRDRVDLRVPRPVAVRGPQASAGGLPRHDRRLSQEPARRPARRGTPAIAYEWGRSINEWGYSADSPRAHLFAESTGLIGGAAYILLQVRRNRRTEMTAWRSPAEASMTGSPQTSPSRTEPVRSWPSPSRRSLPSREISLMARRLDSLSEDPRAQVILRLEHGSPLRRKQRVDLP